MFEDFGKKISVFGQQMVKKTGEVAELASLKTKAMAKKKKIQDEMLALGKAYYEAHKDEITEFEEKITAINNLYTELECLEEELKELKEKLPEDTIFEEEPLSTESTEDADIAEETTEEKSEVVTEEAERKTVAEEQTATENEDNIPEEETKEEVKEDTATEE